MHAKYLEGKLTIKTKKKKITLSFPFWYLEIVVLYIEGEKIIQNSLFQKASQIYIS